MAMFTGKHGLIVGVANKRSIRVGDRGSRHCGAHASSSPTRDDSRNT